MLWHRSLRHWSAVGTALLAWSVAVDGGAQIPIDWPERDGILFETDTHWAPSSGYEAFEAEEPIIRMQGSTPPRDFDSDISNRPLGNKSARDRRTKLGPATDRASGAEGSGRGTTDAGDLAANSHNTLNVKQQKRNPVVTNTKVRSYRQGQTSPNGSYWVPARYDLDTMLSKIDSRSVREMRVIKGPYSARHGPGFSFIDLDLLGAPRYEGGPSHQRSSSLEYKTNGEQWYGRQSVWGGAENWGYRLSYGHRTGNDYQVGSGTAPAPAPGVPPLLPEIPASYNSRNIDAAIGYDPTEDSSLEFTYLRLDQTGVEFPGLVFDINSLVTDGFELTYELVDQLSFDLLQLESWYNRTRFNGDTFGAGKNRQIPTVGIFADITDVDQLSTGFSGLVSWGDPESAEVATGVDLRYVAQELNDIDIGGIGGLGADENFPIPPSHSANPGLFLDCQAASTLWTVRAGGRIDFVATDADNIETGRGTIATILDSDLPQQFWLWSVYVNADYAVNDQVTAVAGVGYGQRPPTLTELYATQPFIGVFQTGLTVLTGDPQLQPERNAQIDLGLVIESGRWNVTANAFYAHIDDYITFDAIFVPAPSDLGQLNFPVVVTNTELATLAGFELYAAYDWNELLTIFGTMSFVEGRDHTRDRPSRNFPLRSRSNAAHTNEPLPGIPPLDTRVGVLLQDPREEPQWGLELSARIVAAQTRFAQSLGERSTEAFTIGDIRGFWRPRPNWLLIGGVENFTDSLYREHLDYRSGRGVFQPGVNFYTSAEVTY